MADWLPVTFALWGLDQSWDGPRWFESWWGSAPLASGVFLSHGRRPVPARGYPWVQVGSWEPSGEGWWSPDWWSDAPERDLAWHAIHHLVDVVALSLEDVDERRRRARNHIAFVDRRAARWARWAPANWRGGSRKLSARFTRFGGGWAGYAFEPGAFAITVVAKGISPHNLGLRKLTSGTPYHFDLDQPIDAALPLASVQQALGEHAADLSPRHRRHRDLQKVLDLDA